MFEINKLAAVLADNHKAGNKGIITLTSAKKAGIPEATAREYVTLRDRLFEATVRYCTAKNSPDRDLVEVAKLGEDVLEQWRLLLNCSDEKTAKRLSIADTDIGDLAGFCQMFMDSSINWSLESKFVSPKVFTSTTYKAFSKNVETMLGIRLNKSPVASATERDYASGARKALGELRRANSTLESLEAEADSLEAEIAILDERIAKAANPTDAAKAEAVKAYLSEKLTEVGKNIKAAKAAVKTAKGAVSEVKKMTPEEYAAAAEAEYERKLAEHKAARAAKAAKKAAPAEETAPAKTTARAKKAAKAADPAA